MLPALQVASWVAQASFEPLGLTVAVAKDRAIESLMQVRELFFHFFNSSKPHTLAGNAPKNNGLGANLGVHHVCCVGPCVQVGDNFVVNCLGEKSYSPLMKVKGIPYVLSVGSTIFR